MSPYEQVMGEDDWQRLAPVIRAIHSPGEVRGTLRIRRGTGTLARLLAWLLRLPPPGEAVEVRLLIRSEGDRMQWTRFFGAKRVRTSQQTGRGLVRESYGPFVIAFRPTRNGTGVDHVQTWAAFGAARWHVRLPALLSPCVSGSTREEAGAAYLEVEVKSPIVGRVIAYDGLVRPVAST